MNATDSVSAVNLFNTKEMHSVLEPEYGLNQKIKTIFFRMASYLTDPVCRAHEFFRRICIVDVLNPESSIAANLARKVIFAIGLVGLALVAAVTTLPGIGLRSLGCSMQKEPYTYMKADNPEKKLPASGSFTMLSWNILGLDGYAISDGGAMPWRYRKDAVIDQIVQKNADVVCSCEAFDINTSVSISDELKQKGYSHFFFNMGPKGFGVPSGLMVASKYKIVNPEFSPFPLETLVGRTKNCSKGIFKFDLESEGRIFATVFSTHMQHSDEPEYRSSEEADPIKKKVRIEEEEGRREQMKIIVDKIDKIKDRCVVVTGDLNLDDLEYAASDWSAIFQKGDVFSGKTWGGDGFCARMVGKRPSGPLNLDHTMLVKGTAQSIVTTRVETGFDGEVFRKDALSDHSGLFTEIAL